MMEEKDLVEKLTLLKEVKPRDNWVLFAKREILESGVKEKVGQEGLGTRLGHLVSYLRYLERPAYVVAALALVVSGVVGFQASQNSVPGDTLYSVRSAIERASVGSDPLASLEVAQLRLQDLKKVVEENRVKNLSSATQEFEKSVAEASKGFRELVEKEPEKALQASRELVQLQKDKAQVERLLGAALGEEEASEIESTTKLLVEAELNDLVERSLSEEQEDLLEEAIVAYQAGNYETALEKIWEITN